MRFLPFFLSLNRPISNYREILSLIWSGSLIIARSTPSLIHNGRSEENLFLNRQRKKKLPMIERAVKPGIAPIDSGSEVSLTAFLPRAIFHAE